MPSCGILLSRIQDKENIPPPTFCILDKIKLFFRCGQFLNQYSWGKVSKTKQFFFHCIIFTICRSASPLPHPRMVLLHGIYHLPGQTTRNCMVSLAGAVSNPDFPTYGSTAWYISFLGIVIDIPPDPAPRPPHVWFYCMVYIIGRSRLKPRLPHVWFY